MEVQESSGAALCFGKLPCCGCRGWVSAVAQVSTAGGGANRRASTEAEKDPDPAFGTSTPLVSASLTSQQQTNSELAKRTLLCLPRESHLLPSHSLWSHCRSAPKRLLSEHLTSLLPGVSPDLFTSNHSVLVLPTNPLTCSRHPLPKPSATPLTTCHISSFSTLPYVPPNYSNIHSLFAPTGSLSFPQSFVISSGCIPSIYDTLIFYYIFSFCVPITLHLYF